MKINTKKIGTFLQSLNDAERKYLAYALDISQAIQKLIKDFDLDQEAICLHFDIAPLSYQSFISGNWNYNVKEMAALNALYAKLEGEAIKDKVPVQVDKM